jgi:hypothetical protein
LTFLTVLFIGLSAIVLFVPPTMLGVYLADREPPPSRWVSIIVFVALTIAFAGLVQVADCLEVLQKKPAPTNPCATEHPAGVAK